ncbi:MULTISPECIES: hypothetical protein [Thiomicrorhabdus]|uniref:Uncharacterized protein n=1 Tax=Thiomicrorhabdus heinhorstiae TaxID=2748010 RepID=A0ABS0BUZ0_9GAMM|nr:MULTISPECIES: hypothetical protein [Thiomicrorhabdus]MBF6057619.1 hypothetical protein [Thiomicrorhabdus heinhorstiae]
MAKPAYYDDKVINLRYRLKGKQLLECFDKNLLRLQRFGVDENESETSTLELLSEWLEEAIENGIEPYELQERANRLARYAFEHGYHYHEVEALLTMRPNPNGRRL